MTVWPNNIVQLVQIGGEELCLPSEEPPAVIASASIIGEDSDQPRSRALYKTPSLVQRGELLHGRTYKGTPSEVGALELKKSACRCCSLCKSRECPMRQIDPFASLPPEESSMV